MKGQAMTDTRQVLEEAFKCIFGMKSISAMLGLKGSTNELADKAQRFRRFLDAEAWTDAAMMLVPEGWLWEVQWIGHQTKGRVANAHIWKRFDQSHFAAAAHPALALAQACLKARENSDG